MIVVICFYFDDVTNVNNCDLDNIYGFEKP